MANIIWTACNWKRQFQRGFMLSKTVLIFGWSILGTELCIRWMLGLILSKAVLICLFLPSDLASILSSQCIHTVHICAYLFRSPTEFNRTHSQVSVHLFAASASEIGFLADIVTWRKSTTKGLHIDWVQLPLIIELCSPRVWSMTAVLNAFNYSSNSIIMSLHIFR